MKKQSPRRSGRLALQASLLTLVLAAASPAASSAQVAPVRSRVTFDGHSFLIDGKRTYLWSGEFHPYRLPSPALWADIFQKMKAAGFNTASIYFSWGYHSAAPGQYDFSGVRDMDRLLDAARDAGIYIIARPGPYINAEVDSGGFPLWLTTRPVRNRSADPAYLRLADEWLTQIDRIIARHQIDDGRGTVIAYQVENEYYKNSPDARDYMAHLEAKARADGITVPLVGNHNGTFVSGAGAVEVSGWDHYPQGFDCSHPEKWKPAPDMSAEHGSNQPIFAAEYQGGAFDPWGGPGYTACAQLINDRFASVFYKQNIAAGATAQNFYMVYGGTSWGWQAIPQNYTSYDYGAAITEGRQFDPKYYEMKRIGYMLGSMPSLLKTDASPPASVDNAAVIDIARSNPDTGAQSHLLRHKDSTSTEASTFHLGLSLEDGHYPRVPQQPGTTVALAGREAKLLVAGVDLGMTRLVYSTSELMTDAKIGNRDIAVFYGSWGTDGETVLRFVRRPKVAVLSGSVEVHWEHGRDLRLTYRHQGLARVLVRGQGRRPLLLLLADRAVTRDIWRQGSGQEVVLMIGSSLLRRAEVRGTTLALRGDVESDGNAEIYASDAVRKVTWNGASVAARKTQSGSLTFPLRALPAIPIPHLGGWMMKREAPEIDPSFSDANWRVADVRETSSVTKPGSLPVLFADDYGFHVGNTWYRGHFSVGESGGGPTGLKLKVQSGGKAGAYSVWLNGHFLGSVTGTEEGSFQFAKPLLRRGDNVVSVLTVDMGHEEDYDSKGENRTARGIVSAIPIEADASSIIWKIQGRRGGEGATDPIRGPYNEGGLYGEREGWHLGHDGPGWQVTGLPSSDNQAGVVWYRAKLDLDLPKDGDVSLGLLIQDPPGRHYRAMLFVNGWQFGNYVSDLGPQHSFPIPAGILNHQGANDIKIAVWKTDQTNGGLGQVSLVQYGAARTDR